MDIKPYKRLALSSDMVRKYIGEIAYFPILSREEEFEVTRLVHEKGDRDAIRKLVLSNLRLVVKIALEYYNIYHNILDLIQEGNVGLLRAVKMYSPYKGTKFSSYAAKWIKAYIKLYLMNSRSLVKVATTQAKRRIFSNLNKEKRKLESMGIYPTPELLAKNMGVKKEEVEEVSLRLSHLDLQLDAPLHGEDGYTVMDTIASGENVEEIVSRREESEILSRKITDFKANLDYRDSVIFERRILAEEPETLDEIGARFNISRERARQLEARIMNTLRTSLEEYRVALGY